MSVPKGFKPLYRHASATKLGVKINPRTGHLLFNTLAKQELLDMLDNEHTSELVFYFDEDTNQIYMTPAREGERGWKLNAKNGMVSAARVRDWLLDHNYQPGTQYSLIAHERGFLIEPETTLPLAKTEVEARVHRPRRRTEAVEQQVLHADQMAA